MPIYEFYCSGCNTLYNFLSRTIDTETRPNCPRCRDLVLERRLSIFSMIRPMTGEDEPPGRDLDENKLGRAMEMLAREAESIDEENPKQTADLLRKMTGMTGFKLKPGMEEALRRLEQGEDPERIEREMEDIFDEEDPFEMEHKSSRGSRSESPRVDKTLYEM